MTTKKKPTQKSSSAAVKTTDKTYKYKVESNIKITGNRQAYSAEKFPFPLMKVGDSFLIPANDPVAKNPNVLHYAAKMYARANPGFTITTRMQLNKERRVWRLK